MAKMVTKRAEIGTAFGNTLEKPIPFTFEYEELEKGDPIPAKEQLDENDILSVVNQRRAAAARSAATQAALKENGIERPTLEGNVDLQIKAMVKTLRASEKHRETPEDQLVEIAKTVLGL